MDESSSLITVEDNGPGIPARFATQVFEPFKRLSDGKQKGSGLGLSFCQKILEKHGGRIWIAPEFKEGTRIHLQFPKTKSQAASVSSTTPYDKTPTNKTRRTANVLHVDDSESDIFLTKTTLSKCDNLELNIYNATNGRDALEFLLATSNPRIDLILLDINMSIMDGFEFLSHLFKIDSLRAPPTIICSTSDDERDQQRALEFGAKGYVTKPLRLANLEPAIRTLPSFSLCQRDEGFRN